MALPTLSTPTYEIIQPSTGKPIIFRPFLVKEHKVLLTLKDADTKEVTRIVKDLVDVCTFKKLDIHNIPHFDIEFIFMHLRAKSIGENVDVIITCVNCDEKYESSFSIENIKVDKKDGITNKVNLGDDIYLEFKYPVLDSVLELFDTDEIDSVLKMISMCLVGVYKGNEFYDASLESKENVEDFLQSLTKDQFDKVEEFFVNSPKILQEVESDCPNCNHHNVSRIEGLQNFFV